MMEDDPDARRMFQESAADTQFATLEFAPDVCEALEYFPTRGTSDDEGDAADQPAFLILNLDLPWKDGMARLKELKTSTGFLHRIPVIIFSSNDDRETINEAYDLGANAYVTNPDDFDELVAFLQELKDFLPCRIEYPSD